ncbi:dihydrolipoyl dehydrogenase [Actinopolymorpha singaporensis]|uniref:Dihydrolipoyl dehydrogenase n=1 Tax=Actinopolymorpha singaporensis TaxID=117157 RepID=A0A1H1XDV1_9ACTN|nr:dihydrolipoyl dehydrogenase [Actinopolymorpha singaporensis]SDT07473.1 dihydrolipoamide dehydrogenase [Actinopolymorpha singaporensis]
MADNDAGTSFDLVILGGGSGGYACALRAAELDMRVALVEKDKLGGTCLHRGCIPTKALLHAAEIADNARDGADFGIRSTFEGVDMAGVNKYKDGVVNRAFRGVGGLLRARDVTVVEGAGRLVAPNAVQVNGTRYEAPNIVLATGSYSRTLPGLDIDGERVITSDHALQLTDVPSSVIVLGGGVIGVEFASVWRSFGADVTIIEALPRLLAVEDEASSKAVERGFRKRGITFRTNTPYKSVERTEQGVRLTAESGETFEAELLLVAVGRGPVIADLGYEDVGVAIDRGFVRVDERLRTTVPGIRAAGDIVFGLQLAHRGFQQGIFIAEDIAGLDPAVIDETGIPRVTYCDPEVASMGLTEAAAKEKHGADGIETFTYDLAGNPKSQILKTQGFVKVIRAKNGPIVGIHMVGARVGELVGEAQLIYNWEAFPEEVAQLVHMHPTQSEAIGEAHLALAGKPLHVHG